MHRILASTQTTLTIPHARAAMFATAIVMFYVCSLVLCASRVAAGEQTLEHETIRFFTSNSKPEHIRTYAFSPNGRFLALTFESKLGSKRGVSIVDLEEKQLANRIGRNSLFAVAFTSDSQSLLGIGGYAGIRRFEVDTGEDYPVKNVSNIIGRFGFYVEEGNGKLVITGIVDGANPTIGSQIQVGDEIVAVNEGDTPTRYDDSREWRAVTGMSKARLRDILTNTPGSWVQMRLARRGMNDSVDVSIQRQWPTRVDRRLPSSGGCLTIGESRGVFQFRSADTAQLCASISLRDIERSGQHAISPDGKRFAALAQVVNGRDFCLEVHALESGRLVQSAILDATNFRHLRFSPDSKQVLVGTRDTIEVFDIESAKWQKPVVLTPPDEADPGRMVTRRIPLGLGFPGDLYTTAREVVYSKPAALSLFDVAPDGTLAIGSETGEIVLANLESKERAGLIGDENLGANPEMIEFSPTGRHLAAFAKGTLHMFEFTPSP